MEVIQIQNKIKLLFEKIVEPGYVMNNYYSDGLIDKLSNNNDPEISFLESTPLLLDLVSETFNKVENVHSTVKVFYTRMLAIVCQKELNFTKVFCGKRTDAMVKDFHILNTSEINPSLRVAYMEVALALVQHDSGIKWLLKTGIWRHILSLTSNKQTVFVVRQIYKFTSKLLWKLNDLGDETSVRLVLGDITKPLLELDLLNKVSMTSEEEDQLAVTIEPILQIILSTVSEVAKIQEYNIIVDILIKEHMITKHLLVMSDRMRREDLSLQMPRVSFWLMLARIFLTKPMSSNPVYTNDDFNEISVFYFNTIQGFTQRRSATLILDFSSACHIIWSLVWKDKKLEHDGHSVSLQNKLLFICLVPGLVYVKSARKCMSFMSNERLNEYVVKILYSTCVHTARAAYALRDLTRELNTLTVALQSVKRLTCLKNQLNNEQANMVFQALFYILQEYDPLAENREADVGETFEDDQEKVLVMTYVLDTVLSLVKNYDINWHKSLEVICLYSIVYNILKRPNLSCKFIVTALNIVAVTVKKFLPPNLSLLLETKPGSSMHELGELIYVKMQDRNWEVRDSALELLYVCTELSFVKFPPFQKQIMENKLINLCVTIALNDYESYVQVSALKCIGVASKISSIWDQVRAEYPDIQEKIIIILRNNQEGIVRKEACSVLCQLYQNLKLTSSFKQSLYEHMVSSALSDFHWEVQLGVLKFWKTVIKALFNDQGMLDGTFPPVTFSRQTRKIVTLNEAEIQKRILKILDELASIGCLTVLIKLLQEDTEVDIMEAALAISLELLEILNQYKIPDVIKRNNGEPLTVEDVMCNIVEERDIKIECDDITEPTPSPKADNVIEGILNADDVNLLANIYEQHMNLQADKPETSVPKVKLMKSASPYIFVEYIMNGNFKNFVEQKRKWKDGIRSVSSLLDDVLGIYEINNEVNTLDCY